MKIVAGEYKYRKIEIPEGIRPTTEKVREAVFSMINFSVPGAKVLDLFLQAPLAAWVWRLFPEGQISAGSMRETGLISVF